MTARRAFSLVEVIVAVAITSVLAFGLASAVMIAGRAVDDGSSASAASLEARDVVERMTRDLHFAQRFENRDARTVTFTVPDRDGDGLSEHITYKWSGVPGDPLQYKYNGTKLDLVENVQQLDLSYLYRTMTGAPLPGAGGGPAPEVLLLVVVDASLPSGQDTARIALFESWGYTVNLISASDSQASFDTAVKTADVAYVTEQQQSIALGIKLLNAPIGVVVEEAELAVYFGLSSNRDWPSPRTTVEIVDNTHEITSPFAPGLLAILSADAEVVSLAGQIAAGGRVLATHEWSGPQPGLLAVESGAELTDLFGTAANRRVKLPWGRTGFDINVLNADGRTLMRRAVEWAAAGVPSGGGGPADARFGYDTEFPTPVSGVQRVQIATRATLSESGSVESITAYVGGVNNRGMRLAVYSDSGGEPDALLVESGSVNTSNSAGWVTAPVTATALAAGDYWLALAFERDAQTYYQDSDGETRYHAHDAEANGFLATWGFSDESYSIKVSIYATYVPD